MNYIVFRSLNYFLELELTEWWANSVIILIPITVYLTRRWSKKWNEQLQNPKNDDSTIFTKFFNNEFVINPK